MGGKCTTKCSDFFKSNNLVILATSKAHSLPVFVYASIVSANRPNVQYVFVFALIWDCVKVQPYMCCCMRT